MKSTRKNYSFDYLFRVILIGDSGVGKTNIFLRYLNNDFEQKSLSTIGVDFGSRSYVIDGNLCKVQIWDTAGQDRFKSISTSFYRGSSAALLVYDITNYTSFLNIQKWNSELSRLGDPNTIRMLVGNKADLTEQRSVDTDVAKDYAMNNSMSFIETSALSSLNVEEAFSNIVNEIYWTRMRRESKDLDVGDLAKKIDIKKISLNSPSNNKCC